MQEQTRSLTSTLLQLNSIDLHFVYIIVVLTNGIPNARIYSSDQDKVAFLLKLAAENSGFAIIATSVINHCIASLDSMKWYKKHTDWIDPTNKRLCIFLWLSVLKHDTAVHNPEGLFGKNISTYALHQMPTKPSSSSQCLQYFDDFLYVFIASQQDKIDLINNVRNSWEHVIKFPHKMLKTIENFNEEDAQWFWEYWYKTTGIFQTTSTPQYPTDFYTFKEKIPLVLAWCDSLVSHPSDKILALDSSYKAFHSKKHKRKPKDKKGATYWLGSTQVLMLNEIAIHKKLSEKDTLHSLIQDEYLKSLNKK